MSEDSGVYKSVHPDWEAVRSRLQRSHPTFFELEVGGALLMDLGSDGWLLELTPDGRLLCQMGMDIEDIMSLMSEGTPEDLGTDEVAKQAKYYLQPAVAKHRKILLASGFEEATEMNEEYVATTFHRTVDFRRPEKIEEAVQWCRKQFGA